MQYLCCVSVYGGAYFWADAATVRTAYRRWRYKNQKGSKDKYMKRKTVDVIIPVYHPQAEWKEQIAWLEKQDYPVQRIIIMNTGKENWKKEYETWSCRMEVHHVKPEEFDHGGTRDKAARIANADYLLFMTQDAVPRDTRLITNLVKHMEEADDIRAVYARQLPAADCRLAEQYTRSFNYPAVSSVKRKSDLPRLGIKTYFCSNVCAMYDRNTYMELGGFVKHTIFNEDMIYAGRLVQSGYAVAYAADAEVIHSHNYSAWQQFHRNFDLGVSQADHPEIFAGIKSEGEGIRLVKSTAAWLCRQKKIGLVIPLLWNSGWKYLGYLLGKRYQSLPRRLILRFTMNRRYWRNI